MSLCDSEELTQLLKGVLWWEASASGPHILKLQGPGQLPSYPEYTSAHPSLARTNPGAQDLSPQLSYSSTGSSNSGVPHTPQAPSLTDTPPVNRRGQETACSSSCASHSCAACKLSERSLYCTCTLHQRPRTSACRTQPHPFTQVWAGLLSCYNCRIVSTDQ